MTTPKRAARPPKVAPTDGLQRLVMPWGNTCANCGKPLAVGEVVYATSFDAVKAGQGICPACAGGSDG